MPSSMQALSLACTCICSALVNNAICTCTCRLCYAIYSRNPQNECHSIHVHVDQCTFYRLCIDKLCRKSRNQNQSIDWPTQSIEKLIESIDPLKQ